MPRWPGKASANSTKLLIASSNSNSFPGLMRRLTTTVNSSEAFTIGVGLFIFESLGRSKGMAEVANELQSLAGSCRLHWVGCLLDESGHRVWLRHVNRMAPRYLNDC